MAHKNAQQLIGEVRELLNEVEVYASQRDALFESLAGLERAYHSGKGIFLDYERRKKSILRSRTREEWEKYYTAYISSVLKKAEFIVSQILTLVYDDNSLASLKIKGKAAVPVPVTLPSIKAVPVQLPVSRAQPAIALAGNVEVSSSEHIHVFNIDNEIVRLKQLIVSGHASVQQAEERVEGLESKAGRLSSAIPKFDDIVKEIEEVERKAAEPVSVSAPATVIAPKPVKLQPAPKLPVTKSRPQGQPGLLEVYRAPKGKQHLLDSLFKPFIAAGRILVDIPLTAAMSLRDAARKVGLLVQKKPGFQPQLQAAKPAKAPKVKHPFKFRLFGKNTAPLVTFKEQTEVTKQAAVKPVPEAPFGRKQGVFSKLLQALNPNKVREGIFAEEIVAMEGQKASEAVVSSGKKDGAGLSFGWFSTRGILREFADRFRPRQEPIMAETTAIPVHVKKLKAMRKKLYDEERLSGFDSTLLAQEARRVKKILDVERPEVYQGSSVGLIANLTVRKLSLYLVDTFPEFFGFLYNALRSANVKVLSNTYVNIMILSTLFIMVASSIILFVMFFIFNYPLYQIFLRSIILSLIAGFSCATIFYAYPFMRIKDRRRNIVTNMPFAANHMAAVATSGVPPASMFELIAASKEYGEIGVEVKKIVDFINIFGYDLLTALRTVAATTPSQQFKEFLEGMVSTIETGGDLDRYLRQEADQAALTYNLERQRYNETISTYSDIYTGLLIAAPLFFVAALSLVNLLGGTIGGIGVDVVMSVGAYVVIPLLNIGFLAFLQFSQPEV